MWYVIGSFACDWSSFNQHAERIWFSDRPKNEATRFHSSATHKNYDIEDMKTVWESLEMDRTHRQLSTVQSVSRIPEIKRNRISVFFSLSLFSAVFNGCAAFVFIKYRNEYFVWCIGFIGVNAMCTFQYTSARVHRFGTFRIVNEHTMHTHALGPEHYECVMAWRRAEGNKRAWHSFVLGRRTLAVRLRSR